MVLFSSFFKILRLCKIYLKVLCFVVHNVTGVISFFTITDYYIEIVAPM